MTTLHALILLRTVLKERVVNVKDSFIVLTSGLAVSISLIGCNSVQIQDQSPASSNASSSPSISPTSGTNSGTPVSKVPSVAETKKVQPSPQSIPPLTVQKLKNAEYFFLAKGPVRLVNGKYEDKSTQRTISFNEDGMVYGDLNKDGVKDAIASLKVTLPNSGDVSYLVTVVNENGIPKNTSAEFLGPQVRVKTIAIKPDGAIGATIQQFRPGDPACCPSLELTRTYKLRNPKASDETKVAPKK